MLETQNAAVREVLPGPYAQPASGDEVRPSPAVMNLARSQVAAILEASPAYRQMPPEQRQEMFDNMLKIAAYTGALVQDDFIQSGKLGQTPVLIQEPVEEGAPPAEDGEGRRPLARAAEEGGPAAEEFSPRAASQVADITKQTLNAIAFPTFVADLIQGTFRAIVDAAIDQMEAYAGLLANVAKTVDQFMAENITDNQARDFLATSYPGHFRVEIQGQKARVRLRENADQLPRPDFEGALGLSEKVELDDDTVEEVLVPAARRRLAQQRHQVLSTMVLMGINRIVVTSGRIKAKMGFRINTQDTATAESASQFDWKNETTASYGGGLWGWLSGGPSVKMKNTVAYVSSTKKNSSDDLDVNASLTGEVDLKFKSDYFPLERFADSEAINLIKSNTANPQANTPVTGTGGGQQPQQQAQQGAS